MDISFDAKKRARTFNERGLDFADVGLVVEGDTATIQDDRRDFGEDRFVSAGYLERPDDGGGVDAPKLRPA